ncbi:phosphotransferase family protein [Pseudomonas baltica]|uniref:phosphotransferase family protein n=1 Tax=Pseudomonas baltica TaxID=2762576 RepID=UPI002896FD8D|nr:phosphotransferase family protein [Pseudomonas baltica]
MNILSSGNTPLADFGGLLDWPRLQAWIEHSEMPGQGPVTAAQQLTGGSQNNLFLLTRGTARFVLRRPPAHLREHSNATILREARVLKALADSDVPHPRLLGACDDPTVLGACFLLMAPLPGFSPLGELPGRYARDADWRAAMGPEFVRAAAALARVDHQAVGLADFGKPDHWHSRQVERWRAQLDGYQSLPGYTGAHLQHIDSTARWLQDNLPTDGRIGIIHGDLQWPNAMFAYDQPRIVGLIDWELSTLGDPLLDLAWTLSSWREPGDPQVGAADPVVRPWDGFGSRAEMISLYGELTGRDMHSLPWFFVLACFKLACILEGSHARSLSGGPGKQMGEFLHDYAVWLMAKARQLTMSL